MTGYTSSKQYRSNKEWILLAIMIHCIGQVFDTFYLVTVVDSQLSTMPATCSTITDNNIGVARIFAAVVHYFSSKGDNFLIIVLNI